MNNETKIMQRIMLALPGFAVVFRNNIGVGKVAGSFVRYGVGGKGGCDLIGYTSRVITQSMVGERVAIFTAIEVKATDGRTTPEQDHFITVISEAGGKAGVARSIEDAMDIIA
jgi:hypothetical protein